MKKNHGLTIEQQLLLVSGKDFWGSEDFPDLNIPSIRMSDGPHGLRYQADASDHLGINDSAKATAFPTATALASTWQPDLIKEMGDALGKEARSLDIDVVLGPGANIKRNPLAGRNFEFFSEDPYLSGEMAAAWINGIQQQNVGASLKHYAGNNQETDRLLSDSLIDQRALHELYLEAFRIAVTESQPETVMHAYNKVNGTYLSESDYLLNDVLRKSWGFEGAVISDWGALNDPVKSLNAGTDLEMPGNEHLFLPVLKKALQTGELSKEALNRSTEKLVEIATKERPKFNGDRNELLQANDKIAQKIEEEAIVLLRNEDDVLPLKTDKKLLVVGSLAKRTRYQGAGSSHINPFKTWSILNGLDELQQEYDYAAGYTLNETENTALVQHAVEAADNAEQIVVVVGLPDAAEAEGVDRTTMALPDNQNKVVEALAGTGKPVSVVVVSGSVVEMPWQERVAGILDAHLGGQRVGTAVARVLMGQVNPSGRLAESYPFTYDSVPSSEIFGKYRRSVPYAESLYVGYRYYDKSRESVAFPFGYGLSYTSFTIQDCTLSIDEINEETKDITIKATVTNTGAMDGSTVVQVYVGDREQRRLTPIKSLKAFAKVFVPQGQTKQVAIKLTIQAFKYWDSDAQRWQLYTGQRYVEIANNAEDVIERLTVQSIGNRTLETDDYPDWYLTPQEKPSVAEFTEMSGLEVVEDKDPVVGELTSMNTPRELGKHSVIIRKFTQIMLKQQIEASGNDSNSPETEFLRTIVLDTPLMRLAQQSSGALKLWQVRLLVSLANHPVRTRLFGKGKIHG